MDVVVAGSGFGGLATAIAAASFGLRVVVLERAGLVGGSTSHSYGGVWVANNEVARAKGVTDSRAAAMAYMAYVGGMQTDARRVAAFIDAAPRALAFFQRAGIALELTPALHDHFYGTADGALADGRHFDVAPFAGARLGAWRDRLETPAGDVWRIPLGAHFSSDVRSSLAEARARARERDELCQGAGLVAYALRSALERNVEVLLGVAAERLLVRDGRVIGVHTEDGRDLLAARGVVLATGGYESDLALGSMIENLPGYRSVHASHIVADGLRMATEAGAAFRIVHHNLALLMAYEEPTKPNGRDIRVIANKELVAPHGIVVNRTGERFGNEGSFQNFASAVRAFDGRARRMRNLPCWLVFDQQFVERSGFGVGLPGTVPDWVVRAESPAALADVLGIPARTLVATIERFNAFVAGGADRDFARGEKAWSLAQLTGVGPNPGLGSLEKAPFYAVPLVPTTIGASGLAADDAARVLDWWDAPIPGLFAVGNAAAHDEYGTGYQAGQSLSSAMTFGLLAAEALAGEARSGTPLGGPSTPLGMTQGASRSDTGSALRGDAGSGFDVVVVGGGFAGLTAGIAAAEFGLRVLVLEAGETFGGAAGTVGAGVSEGLIWIGGDRGVLELLAAGQGSAARMDAYLEGAPVALEFLRRAGLAFEPVSETRDGSTLRVLGGISSLLRVARERDVALLAGARACRLVVEGGRVAGIGLADGRVFSAGAVVLATGGYASDPVLTARFEDVPGLRSAYPATVRGDGLRMGGSVGGRVHLVRNNLAIALVDRDGRGGSEPAPAEVVASLRTFDAATRTCPNGADTGFAPALIACSAGLAADIAGCVMDWRGNVVPGLYAIGDAAAHDEFGAGYQTGSSLSSALTFALRAAKHIASPVVGRVP